MNGEAKVISIGDLFRQSWKTYRGRAGLLTKIISLPVAFLMAGDLLGLFAPSGLAGLLAFIGTVISFFAYLALVFALQENIQFGEAYRRAWKKIWSYGWLTLLSGFAVLGGFVMLVIPGVIFSIWFAFATYVFVIEGEKGMSALLRSREYVRGYWWQVFGRQIVFGLAALVAIMLLGLVGTVLGGEAGASFIVNLFILLLAPVSVAYVYTLYQNLKSLKPEVGGQLPAGPRGFFYFSAVLGILGLIIFMVLMVLAAALFVSGGFGPDVLPNTIPK